MAEGDGILYKSFKDMLMKGIDLLEEDSVYLTLHTAYGPHRGSLRALIDDPFTHEAIAETEVILYHEGS